MDEIKERIKDEIDVLTKEGSILHDTEYLRCHPNLKSQVKNVKDLHPESCNILIEYQSWFTRSLPIIRQLLPDRYDEFLYYYRNEKRNIEKIDFLTYTISDYINNIQITSNNKEVFSSSESFSIKFKNQISILASAKSRIDILLSDIEGVLQNEIFKHELEAADDLLKKNHLRAAGVLAGVSLETHLKHVCNEHKIQINKKEPCLSDFNDALKKENILDIPTWRHILLLSDVRNLCAHSKDREPTKEEVSNLLSGTRMIISTVF